MAEVALGGTLLVMSGGQDPATTAVFGRVGSVVAVAAAMAVLAATMALAVLAPRLPRGVLVSGLTVFSFVIAFVGVLSIASLMTAMGVGLLLAFSWILTIPVALEIRRASSPQRRNLTRKGES
jgi:hypothetical protein